MPPEPFQEAVSLIKAGQNRQGQQLLIKYLQTNPQHEAAWMWLVQTMPSDAERIKTLEACLRFNPDSMVARQALDHFKQQAGSPAPVEEKPAAPAPSSAAESLFLPGSEHMYNESAPSEPESFPAAAAGKPGKAAPPAKPVAPVMQPAVPYTGSFQTGQFQPAPAGPEKPRRRGARPVLVAGGIILLLAALAAVIWLGTRGSPFAATPLPTRVLPSDTPAPGLDATRLALSTRIAAGLQAAPTPLPSITAVSQPGLAQAAPEYIIRPESSAAGSQINGPFDLNGSAVLFYASALQKYNRPRNGLEKIKDFAGVTQANGFTVVGTQLYFYTSSQAQGVIWRSDGTAAGTVEVKAGGIRREQFDEESAALGSLYFFVARDDQGIERLWRSDGSAGGTITLTPPGGTVIPRYLTVVGDSLFFIYQDATRGLELWKSDGSAGGTQLVKAISSNSQPGLRNMAGWKGLLYFAAFDADNNPGLWTSDGTPDGTLLVTGFGGDVPADAIGQIAAAGDGLFLAIVRGPNLELWKSDGTAEGTTRLKTFTAEFDLSRLPAFTYANHTLFFIANDGSSGLQLWKSDGTPEGTQVVKAINPGGNAIEISYQQAFQPHLLVAVGNTVFFAADDGGRGVELWQSDGSSDGTQLVADLNPGPNNSAPDNLASAAGSLFFTINDGGLMVYTP